MHAIGEKSENDGGSSNSSSGGGGSGGGRLLNPYQQVIRSIGRCLAPFCSRRNGIPAYGFGDAESGDTGVFALNGGDGVCNDLDDVLK